MTQSSPTRQTAWLLVMIVVIAGYATAFNVGKVAPTLPLIQSELSLTLGQSGWIVSSLSILAMFFGLLMAVVCMKYGAYRVTVTALTLLGLGAIGSSLADSYASLLGFRLLEAIGFVGIAVSAPALITSVTEPRHRPVAMALWSTWLPAGISLMLLISPTLIQLKSWHSVWHFAAGFVILWLLVMAVSFWPHRNRLPPNETPVSKLIRPLFNRATFFIATSFFTFACLFIVVVSFTPIFWLETAQVPTTITSYWMVGIILSHIIGNVASGWLVAAGIPAKKLMFYSFAPATVLMACVFIEGMPLWGQIACTLGFMLIAGLVPGTVFATIPRYVSTPAQVSLMVGFVFQGAATGQFFGPILFGHLIDWVAGDWRWASAYFLTVGLIGSLLMLQIPPPQSSMK
ncbi:MFS transporter [Leucothrix pacifica]|uniref:Major facilitator superfamily (MFS) profile domain-containing protein n=1 Tax=Leucothrix pacifica TaxID=1247513 RepID=A0A317CMZ3_9GAMM|nr:MFS transporter [Leucothrix pacifica]PWQ99679.1 hypothetical protein DKW60_05225 [Leucothrix pacifica]